MLCSGGCFLTEYCLWAGTSALASAGCYNFTRLAASAWYNRWILWPQRISTPPFLLSWSPGLTRCYMGFGAGEWTSHKSSDTGADLGSSVGKKSSYPGYIRVETNRWPFQEGSGLMWLTCHQVAIWSHWGAVCLIRGSVLASVADKLDNQQRQ